MNTVNSNYQKLNYQVGDCLYLEIISSIALIIAFSLHSKRNVLRTILLQFLLCNFRKCNGIRKCLFPSDLVILEIIIQWILKFSQFFLFFGFFFFFPISQSSFSIIILKGLGIGKRIICEFKGIFIKSQIKLGPWLYFQAVRSKH